MVVGRPLLLRHQLFLLQDAQNIYATMAKPVSHMKRFVTPSLIVLLNLEEIALVTNAIAVKLVVPHTTDARKGNVSQKVIYVMENLIV